MATQGPNYPGTAASLANAGTSENANAWTNPANIDNDADEAAITAATYDSPDISELLVASNFGFTIPAGATIDGITVEIERRDQAIGAASDNRVQLGKGTAFANLVGTNKADTATDWPTASAVATYGGAADLWGTTWTVSEINASSFAVFLSVQADAANTDIFVSRLRVTITYTPIDNRDGTVVVTGGGVVSLSPLQKGGLRAQILTGGGVVALASTGAHNASVVVSGGGVAPLAAQKDTSGSIAAITGGGRALAGAGRKDGLASFALTGGGLVTLAGQAGRQVAIVVTGGGVVTIVGEAGGGSPDRSGTITVTGGGSAVMATQKGGQSSVIVTGGGVTVVAVSTGRQAAVVISGGGVASVAASTGRQAAVVLTGGGEALIAALTERLAALQVTGGGVVTLAVLAGEPTAADLLAEAAILAHGGDASQARHWLIATAIDLLSGATHPRSLRRRGRAALHARAALIIDPTIGDEAIQTLAETFNLG